MIFSQATLAETMRKIVDFHLDGNLDWIAQLECGHPQHILYSPLCNHRYWLTTPQGRLGYLGLELACPVCRPIDLALGRNCSGVEEPAIRVH